MVLFFLGCLDPISNRLFFEDAEFLDALPSAEEDRVHYASTTSDTDFDDTTTTEPGDVLEAPPGAPSLFVLTVASVNGVNAMVDSFLGFVDLVRTVPPTSRTEDSRTWGPFPADDAADYDVRMVSTREASVEFTWAFEVMLHGTSVWRPVLAGTHYAGTTVSDGDGDFVFDGMLANDLNGSDEEPFFLEVSYDHRDENHVDFVVWDPASKKRETPVAAYGYTIDPDGAGTFSFDTNDPRFDISGKSSGKAEHWQVTTRWIPDVGGRGDASVSGGDLEQYSLTVDYHECWLPDGTLLYMDDSWVFVDPPVGSPENCTVAQAVTSP